MHYKIAICDDEAGQTKILKDMVSSWAAQVGCSAETVLFSSSEAFLFDCGGDNLFDILLLDVEMCAISGIELAKRIRKTDRRAEIIFVSSHPEFIGEGYEVDALHYLVKPVVRGKLFQVLDRAAKCLAVEPPSLIIHCGGEAIKLTEDRILYVESFCHYICIHTQEREYEIKENISAFQERLTDAFFRIHRSYIVSLACIVRISRSFVTLEDGTELPLARGQYDSVNRAFIEHN